MKKIIATTKSPSAIGPYSQAIEKNGMLFVSGQIPIDPEKGEIIVSSVSEQTKQVMINLNNILEAANYTLDDVVKTTCYLTDLGSFTEMNEVYAQFFTADQPARATIEVSKLPRGAKIEIEAIAVKG
jgi:2-iminobutanoate/2-iminopropanoate deaminase